MGRRARTPSEQRRYDATAERRNKRVLRNRRRSRERRSGRRSEREGRRRRGERTPGDVRRSDYALRGGRGVVDGEGVVRRGGPSPSERRAAAAARSVPSGEGLMSEVRVPEIFRGGVPADSVSTPAGTPLVLPAASGPDLSGVGGFAASVPGRLLGGILAPGSREAIEAGGVRGSLAVGGLVAGAVGGVSGRLALGLSRTRARSAAALARSGASGLERLVELGRSASVARVAGRVVPGIASVVTPKKVRLFGGVLRRSLSVGAFALLSGWVASVGFGLWGQAEAPESPSIIVNKHLIPEAQLTGDWSAVFELLDAADEVSEVNWLEKLGLLSPVSPIVGGVNKLRGNASGISALRAFALREQARQVSGGSVEDEFVSARGARLENERAITDYFNVQRRLAFDYELAARADARVETRVAVRRARNEDARFWLRQKQELFRLEALERERTASFWVEYRKLQAGMFEDRTPSKLGFGLL